MLTYDQSLIGDILGRGCYGKVYSYGADRVLKRAMNDGSRDWIEWCFSQCLRYPAGHEKLRGIPRVYGCGSDGPDHWWAVMERLDSTYGQRMIEGHVPEWGIFGPRPEELRGLAASLEARSGVFFNDLHYNNVMWSEKRGEWVVTDPSAGEYSGTHSDLVAEALTSVRRLPGPARFVWTLRALPRVRKVAQWKVPQLRQQVHMRAH